jgi:hypothetical protein
MKLYTEASSVFICTFAFVFELTSYFGVVVQKFLHPLQDTALYRMQDLKVLSQIGSNCLSESSVLTSMA